ncbi:MAG UNVERIFIED_CONTAM: hypothetical protein LVR18_20550 [Planctomycetaceae bacterium]
MRSPALFPVQFLCLALAAQLLPATTDAQIVPGTGKKLTQVGDDFEDEAWKWNHNGARSSREQDEQTRPQWVPRQTVAGSKVPNAASLTTSSASRHQQADSQEAVVPSKFKP